MKPEEKLKKVINDLVNKEIDLSFSPVVLRQLIQIHYGFVEQSRVRDLIKGLIEAQFIVKIDDMNFKLGSIAYSRFDLDRAKIKEEKENEEAKQILEARPEVD